MWHEITFDSRKVKHKRLYLRKRTTCFEDLLWAEIRNNKLGTKFKRQYSIGPYIVDFYSSKKKLIIEVDGKEHNKEDAKSYDAYRSGYFKSLGQNVLRFKNEEIISSLIAVVNKIRVYISNPPSPEAGEGIGKGEV